MATLRILLDEDVPILLATTLRTRGYDVVHATEVGLARRDDEDIFGAAIASRRAVLTHNGAPRHDLLHILFEFSPPR